VSDTRLSDTARAETSNPVTAALERALQHACGSPDDFTKHGPRERLEYAQYRVREAVAAYRLRYGDDAGEELRYALEGAADLDRRDYEARSKARRNMVPR
jgi:hypothetical protein